MVVRRPADSLVLVDVGARGACADASQHQGSGERHRQMLQLLLLFGRLPGAAGR
jgi:hypothetical protein